MDHDELVVQIHRLAQETFNAVHDGGGKPIDVLYVAVQMHLVLIGKMAISTENAVSLTSKARQFMERGETEAYWREKESWEAVP
jgi:hypothetical protein